MSNPKVSIIVPCYKVERFLPNCVESVINQSYTNWECLLVDDGSPDRCGAICDDYARRDPRIMALHKPNGGVASARNLAVEQADGEWTTFLDGDDFLHPDFVRDLMQLALERKADIAQCGYVRGNDTCFPKIDGKVVVHEYDGRTIFTRDVAKIIVWGKLYKTHLLKNAKIPEGRYFEDDLITWRWYYAAKRIVVTSRPYYYYTCNDASTMAKHKKSPNLSFIEAYDERIAFFLKRKDDELEQCSRRQLCKALMLSYCNPMLTEVQAQSVLRRFRNEWSLLCHSQVVALRLKIILGLFNRFPRLIARMTRHKQ